MKPTNPDPGHAEAGDLDPIERAASEWVLRRAQGLTAAEQADFRRWKAADARHAQVFAEMEEASRLLDGLRATATRAATRPARAPVPRGRWFWTLAPYFGAVAMVAALAWGVADGARSRAAARSPYAESAATQVGGLRKLELPDGSVVTLNTDTAVEVSYSAAERRVVLLRGEAFFSVAKDASRPFWVQAGAVAVRAVGTAFNVRLLPASVNVLVAEGDVRVVQLPRTEGRPEPAARPVDLVPDLKVGQYVQVPLVVNREPTLPPPVVSSLKPRDTDSALAWREGRLEFSNTPLADVVAEFNRYNRHKIVIADAALGSRRFGGAFSAYNIAPLLEILEQSFGVVTEERGEETVIRLGR